MTSNNPTTSPDSAYYCIYLNEYSQYTLGNSEYSEKPNGTLEFIPIFGVGTLDETCAWAKHARRIKFTKEAIEFYNIPEKVVKSNIEKRGEENFYYDENKPYYDFLIGKTVGVVRRMVVNGQKIEKYHCPKYKLLGITYAHMYNMCTVKVESLDDGTISSDINISRVAIPTLLEFK